MFEKVVRNNLVHFLEANDLFNKSQHGFRSGRSCLSQLLDYHDKIVSLLEKGLNVDSVYLDFSKAFDKVDHQIVLDKLSLLGIRGKLLLWIESFLTSRTQQVIVNGVLSNPCPVVSGVPQGSVIGPLLFLVLLSDIDSNIASTFLASFADDTRIWKGISGVTDASALQRDLEVVYQWAEDNNMSFNNLKFEILRFGLDSTLKTTTSYTSPSGNIIDTKEHVRDLGVTMSSDGTFSEHIKKICQSARNMCSWILRSFSDRSHDLMLTTWKTLVLPILDYCSQLWCPQKKGDIQMVEDVQKAFTRKIPAHKGQDYWERLRTLQLYSLERRRERYRIIYVWKMLENMVPNFTTEQSRIRSYASPRHGRRCVVPPVSSALTSRVGSLREGSLSIHGSRLFNILPQHIRNMTNVELPEFKRKLDEFLATVPDEPQSPGYTDIRRAESNSLLHMIQTLGQK
jgi:ribonuclease P/MRP protein subunit RPP40